MALSEEQIIDLFNDACRETFNGLERFRHFAHAVEAEVRKQDDALIQQLVEALDLGHSFGMDCCNSFAERMNGRRQDQLTQLLAEAEQILNAAKAGRARLEGKPTEPPKEQT